MEKRNIYKTTLDSELTKGIRILAAQLGNDKMILLKNRSKIY
jgi:hypothetical protein